MAATDTLELCPSCGLPLTAVVITTEARDVTMRSCSPCDLRWWTADGQRVDPVVVFATR